VEIALLKAATFPRLRAVEEVLAGQGSSLVVGGSSKKAAPTTPTTLRTTNNEPPTTNAFVDRVNKTRPLIGGYLSGAKGILHDGDRLIFTFDSKLAADSVTDAKQSLEQIAAEVFGAPTTIEAVAAEDGPRPDAKQSPLRDDPIVQAFKKHLGGEIVETRKAK
jgi:hypothetical protein